MIGKTISHYKITEELGRDGINLTPRFPFFIALEKLIDLIPFQRYKQNTFHAFLNKAAKVIHIKIKTCLLLAIISIVVCIAGEARAWPWGKKEKLDFSYEFPSGWKIVKMLPASETGRVDKFETKFGACEPCREIAYKYGNFKMFEQMRRVSYENWWAMVVYIPTGSFLNVPKNSKIVMEVINNQDSTVYIESERIAFCLGWIQDYKGGLQHTVLDNCERSLQVKSSQDPGRNDFEWTNLGDSEGPKYVVGYVYFGKQEGLISVVEFSVKGIDSYPADQALSGR